MGSESSIYTYNEGANDYVINFAQLTQRAGNFLVAREEMKDFKWTDLKGKDVLGGRKGGMPEMVFEYILKQNGIDPRTDLNINQGIDFGSTAAAFSEGSGDFTVEFEPSATALESEGKGHVVASLGTDSGYVPYTAYSAKKSYLDKNPDVIQSFTNALQKGMDFVQNHTPEEIAAVIAPQFPETDLNTITTIVTRYYDQKTWKEDLIFEKDSFELLQDILESAGELDSPHSVRISCHYRICKRSFKKLKVTVSNPPLLATLLLYGDGGGVSPPSPWTGCACPPPPHSSYPIIPIFWSYLPLFFPPPRSPPYGLVTSQHLFF